MGKPYQTGVRFTDEQRDALEHIAGETKLDLADVVRYAVDALIKHYHRCGDRLVLPINFEDVVKPEIREAQRKATPAKAA